MDVVAELDRAVHQLLGRASGPMHLRLLLQPAIATALAIRAGVGDARAGNRPFLWQLVTGSGQRRTLLQSAWADVGKVFLIAILLDAAYQGFVLHAFYPLQTALVAVVVAIVPYVLLRGVVTRVARPFQKPGAGQDENPPASGVRAA